MSFLDEPDEPPRRRARGAQGGEPMDPQTVWIRRGIALVGAVALLVVLVIGVRACFDSRKERGYRDYAREVGALVQESGQESENLFELLRDPGGQSPVDLQNQVNGFRLQADRLVERARDTERPDDLADGHRYLIETLEFRRDGLGEIARLLPTALGDRGRARGAAHRDIAAQMQNFLASDVIYSQRFEPRLNAPIRRERIAGVQAPKSQFLPDIDWLRPSVVGDRIDRISGGDEGAASPGLHGTGLAQVNVEPGGEVLSKGQAVEIRATEDLAFAVQVQNQGESAEERVSVTISIRGAGRPVEDEIPSIAQGATETVTIPFPEAPPTGRPVDITVKVAPVPGEKKTDNNEATYAAIFTR